MINYILKLVRPLSHKTKLLLYNMKGAAKLHSDCLRENRNREEDILYCKTKATYILHTMSQIVEKRYRQRFGASFVQYNLFVYSSKRLTNRAT